jgi:hypothetical protein
MHTRHLSKSLVCPIMLAALAGCPSANVPPTARVAPPAALDPPVSRPAAEAPPPPPQPLPEEYAGCPRVRRTGSGALDARERAEARASTWMWPAPCGQVSGWAGIGLVMSGQAAAFSRDGARLLACGVSSNAACVVLDLSRGAVVERVASAWTGGPDGTPVTETPPVKALLQRLGAPAPPGSLPFPDELRASWKVAPGGGALEITLVALSTGDERVVARFPGASGASEQPLVLQGATVSPDGAHFEAHVLTGQGGSGFQIAVVNVYAEAAALFREAARHGGDAGRLAEKAKDAEARGRASAATFILGGPGATAGQ